jgi:hypothetical protein
MCRDVGAGNGTNHICAYCAQGRPRGGHPPRQRHHRCQRKGPNPRRERIARARKIRRRARSDLTANIDAGSVDGSTCRCAVDLLVAFVLSILDFQLGFSMGSYLTCSYCLILVVECTSSLNFQRNGAIMERCALHLVAVLGLLLYCKPAETKMVRPSP